MERNIIKVLFLLNTTVMGGGNISFINLIGGLKENGYEIYVASPDRNMDKNFNKQVSSIISGYYQINLHYCIKNQDNEEKHIIHKLKSLLSSSFLFQFFRMRKEVYAIKKVARANDISIIHTNVGVIHSGYFASKVIRVAHIWHIREYQTNDFGWKILPSKRRFEKYLHNSYVITITEDIRNYFHLQNSKKAKCIYNGCFSKDDTSNIYPKQHYFLCCSRVSEEKCIDEAIRAFSLFHNNHLNQNYKLIIAGFGSEVYLDKLNALVRELNVLDSVVFVGYRNDVKPLMDNALGIIVPSRFEGFGRMTAEATFRSCLIIGRDSGGTREIVNKLGGILFSGNYYELYKKMEYASSLTQEEYLSIVDNARQKAVDLLSNENYVRSVIEVYKTALTDKELS